MDGWMIGTEWKQGSDGKWIDADCAAFKLCSICKMQLKLYNAFKFVKCSKMSKMF